MTPSSLFYGDTLEPAAKNGSISWTELPNEQLPFVFFNVVGDEEMVDEVSLRPCISPSRSLLRSDSSSSKQHASWYNDKEGDRVVEIIRSLLEESSAFSPPLKPSDIGVMAPFREQVWRVRTKLRKVQLGSVDVGSVEVRGRSSSTPLSFRLRSFTLTDPSYPQFIFHRLAGLPRSRESDHHCLDRSFKRSIPR